MAWLEVDTDPTPRDIQNGTNTTSHSNLEYLALSYKSLTTRTTRPLIRNRRGHHRNVQLMRRRDCLAMLTSQHRSVMVRGSKILLFMAINSYNCATGDSLLLPITLVLIIVIPAQTFSGT